MSNINLPVNPGESKTLTFNTADTYMPEDLVFNITSSSNYIVGNPTNASDRPSVGAVTTSPYYATRWRGDCDNITALYSGLRVAYKIPVAGSSSYGVVLDINGIVDNETSEHPVVYNVNSTIGSKYPINTIVDLIYDAVDTASVYINGTNTTVTGVWKICDYDSDTNTNTIGYLLRHNSYAKTVSDTARYYKIYFTSADGTKWVPASLDSTNNHTTAKTVNQRKIDPFGEIVFTNSTTNYSAGDDLIATAGTIWQQYSLTLGYSFNRTGVALTLTTKKNVYIKCAPQSDGSAIIDADIPYVQDLPTTEDGKIYIFLGVATSASNIEMLMKHPVYIYKNGKIQLYTGLEDHSHGNIQNGGTLQTNDITIASGDKLVVTDSSDSDKVARTLLTFDGSTTTQFLSKRGTWDTPTGATLSGVAYCSTAASTAAKTATMPGFALSNGQRIILYLANSSTVASATLNVNSTGAKTVRINSANTTTSNFTAGYWICNYNGTYWLAEKMNTYKVTSTSTTSITVTNNQYYRKDITANTTISVTPSSVISGEMCYVLIHNTASSDYSVTFSAASGTLIGNGTFNIPAGSYMEFSIITIVSGTSGTSVLTYSSVLS